MTIPELHSFLEKVFPQVGKDFTVEDVTPDTMRVRLNVDDRHLRPGGTVSGPAMFSLADVGLYLMVLSRIGPVELAVTTNCSIDFMRKPKAATDLIAEVRLLKLGRNLAVGDVLLHSDGDPAPVAHANLTYAIPPDR